MGEVALDIARDCSRVTVAMQQTAAFGVALGVIAQPCTALRWSRLRFGPQVVPTGLTARLPAVGMAMAARESRAGDLPASTGEHRRPRTERLLTVREAGEILSTGERFPRRLIAERQFALYGSAVT